VLKTTTGGTSWDVQLQDNSLYLSDVCFVNPNDGWISGYTPGRIFHTSNGGTPVELISFTGSVIDGNVQLNWTTATELNNKGFEVLRLVQNENNWHVIGFVPGHGTTTEPKYYSFSDEYLSTGSYRYRLKQIDFDGTFKFSNEIEVEVIAPFQFVLEQNYPNPFNPSTTIQYQLSQDARVTLKVYDILGSEVATLINEEQQAGYKEVNFNGINFASGMYIYRLSIGSFVSTKKMLMIK
jgi:hypothetical protein